MILADTKVGDQLIVSGPYGDRVVTVRRTTKCFVFTGMGRGKFNRAGDIPGRRDHWNHSRAAPATPEQIAIIRATEKRRRLVAWLLNMVWTELTDEQLQDVYASLPDHAKDESVEVK